MSNPRLENLEYLKQIRQNFRDIIKIVGQKKKTDKYKAIQFIVQHWLMIRLEGTIYSLEACADDEGTKIGGVTIQKSIYDPLLEFFNSLI